MHREQSRVKRRSSRTWVAACDVRCRALDHSHPLSVLRDDDGHHERRRGDYFERREVDFLL